MILLNGSLSIEKCYYLFKVSQVSCFEHKGSFKFCSSLFVYLKFKRRKRKQNKTNLCFPLYLKQYDLQNRISCDTSPGILLGQALDLHLKKISEIHWARQAFRSNTSWLLKESDAPLGGKRLACANTEISTLGK